MKNFKIKFLKNKLKKIEQKRINLENKISKFNYQCSCEDRKELSICDFQISKITKLLCIYKKQK